MSLKLTDIPSVLNLLRDGIDAATSASAELYTVNHGLFKETYHDLAFDQGDRLMGHLPPELAYARITLQKLGRQLNEERCLLQTRLATEDQETREQLEYLDLLRNEVGDSKDIVHRMIIDYIHHRRWAYIPDHHITIRIHESRMVLAIVKSKAGATPLDITGASHPDTSQCLVARLTSCP